MYLVISFDFGGSSDVRIHALTHDLYKADSVYIKLHGLPPYQPRYDGDCLYTLLELIEIPEDFLDEHGTCLYWGPKNEHVITLKTNNVPCQ